MAYSRYKDRYKIDGKIVIVTPCYLVSVYDNDDDPPITEETVFARNITAALDYAKSRIIPYL